MLQYAYRFCLISFGISNRMPRFCLSDFTSRQAPQNILVWVDGNGLCASHRSFSPIKALRRSDFCEDENFHFRQIFQHGLNQMRLSSIVLQLFELGLYTSRDKK